MDRAVSLIEELLLRAEELRRENRENDFNGFTGHYNSGKASGFESAAKLIAVTYGITDEEYFHAVAKASERNLVP